MIRSWFPPLGGALPAFATALFAAAAAAATLDLPAGADRAAERLVPRGSALVPTARWAEAGLPALTAEGRVLREAWQAPGTATTLDLLAPLRDQLAAQGYTVIFECETEGCGGFDFRFEAEVLPEPAMHVDLGDFRYLSARHGAAEEVEYLTLMVSRSSSTGFIQIVRVTRPGAVEADDGLVTSAPPEAVPTEEPGPTPAPISARQAAGIAAALEATGRAILADLSFETGSSRLSEGTFASLQALADYLRENPSRKVTLVGHTDASGSLAGNVALSRARARAVLDTLVAEYGVARGQIEADGVGYLMPLASNLTEAGRTANRRVEAVLTSTE